MRLHRFDPEIDKYVMHVVTHHHFSFFHVNLTSTKSGWEGYPSCTDAMI